MPADLTRSAGWLLAIVTGCAAPADADEGATSSATTAADDAASTGAGDTTGAASSAATIDGSTSSAAGSDDTADADDSDDSDDTGPGPHNDGALTQACAQLGANESVELAEAVQSAFDEADLAWQTAFYHDELHGLVQLLGKPANADDAWKHQYYTIATGTWTVVSEGQWNNSGHVYGNLAMDFTTGDLFQSRSTFGSDAPRRLRWWQADAQAWTVAPVGEDIYDGAMESHANGICYHPDLYGPGDGGAIWNEQGNVHFWRKSTDARESIAYEYGTYGGLIGANVYWPAQGAAFVGGSGGAALMRVTPNETPGQTPIVTTMAAPPISTAGDSHETSTVFGSLHVHPGDPDLLLLLETVGPRAWTSTDGDTWTPIDDHPFTRMPRVVASLRADAGCVWAIGADERGSSSVLWKPAT